MTGQFMVHFGTQITSVSEKLRRQLR